MVRKRRIGGIAALLAGLAAAAPMPIHAADGKVEDIAGKMGGVVDELGRKQTGEPVQGEQKAIISDLDALIASLEKDLQGAMNGIKENKARQGMRDSTISRGNGESGPLINPNDGGKEWGKLTDRERDRILQSMTEGFPPEYRTVLERYYRRLAEEKSAKKTSAPAATATATAPAKP